MKSLILVIFNIVVFGWAAVAFTAETPPAATTEDPVKAELEQLKKTLKKQVDQIQKLTKEFAELKQRVQELEDLCEKHGIDPNESNTSAKAKKGEYVYRGKVRSQGWFERNYRILCDKIAYVDGTYIDITDIKGFSPHPPDQLGDIRELPKGFGPKILQIVKPGEALIEIHPIGMFHATGLSEKAVDKALLNNYTTVQVPDERGKNRTVNSIIVYQGLYQYVTLDGGSRTIGSYKICPPMTREQFADALANDFAIEPILQRAAQMERESRKKGPVRRRRSPPMIVPVR